MKKIVFILLGVLVVGIVAMVSIKKEIVVTRSITIQAPSEKISYQVRNFKEFVKWSPWAKLDPEMKKEFFGEDGTVGAKYTWTGNEEVGTGSQELVEVSKETVKTKLIFTAPWESESDIFFNFSEKDQVTEVTWGYIGEMPFMMTLFVDMDAMLGEKYEEGLKSLKKICEEK